MEVEGGGRVRRKEVEVERRWREVRESWRFLRVERGQVESGEVWGWGVGELERLLRNDTQVLTAEKRRCSPPTVAEVSLIMSPGCIPRLAD